MSETTVPYTLPWALPFIGLVLSIAMAPLVSPGHWRRHYGKIVLVWALAFVLPSFLRTGFTLTLGVLLGMALAQFLPFVLLLGTLYIVAGGLRISGAPRATPGVNTAMLAIGTVAAGVIGTPGAALLMLRPLIRANRHRRQSRHVFVFFIFLVANIGGALSPLGNPPLFLGYLRGVPFFWPSVHLALPTAMLCAGLLASFYLIDSYVRRRAPAEEPEPRTGLETLGIEGRVNLLLLAAALAAVSLRVFWTSPLALVVLGVHWNIVDIVADALLLAVAGASLVLTPAATRQANDFVWEPMVEVAVLFAAIFVTLIPVMAMMAAGAAGPAAPAFHRLVAGGVPDVALFYRATGLMSAVLDNAPSYLLFFGLAGNDAARLTGPLASTLAAISAGACYFGGLTYIGNAPNLMVKAIVESHGLRMPGFLGYIGWAAIFLLPWLLLNEALFFHPS